MLASPPPMQDVCYEHACTSTKFEYRNPEQTQILNDQNSKRRLIDGVIGFVSVI